LSEQLNQEPNPGWGLVAGLKIIAAILVMIIAGAAIGLVLDLLSLEAFKALVIKTLLVGGVSAAAGVVLGLLARTRK